MCEDCGCQQANERAYFGAPSADGEAEPGAVHVHVYLDDAAARTVHVHVHSAGGGTWHTHAHADHHHDHGDGTHHHHHHDHGDATHHHHAHDHGDGSHHHHGHVHGGDSHSPHGGEGARGAQGGTGRRTVAVKADVLAKNDLQAAANRAWFDERGIRVLNLISSPGSGKTLLLERTLERIADRVRCAVMTGDQQTDNDARRLSGKGAPVAQIETRSSCHLSAQQVHDHLSVVAEGTQLLFLENVGNLVCPAAFDLGEHQKVALLSVTEGEDKPLKYPVLFAGAPVCVITKIDLLANLDASLAAYEENVRRVRPDARIFPVSALSGAGMDAWTDFLVDMVRAQ